MNIHSTEPPPLTMIEAALYYAVNGFTVFPVPPGEKKSYKSKKHSNGVNWGATNDPATIQQDFIIKWPGANIGLPTGSGTGFFVVEADTPEGHDVDGIASLAALQALHGAFPVTRMARSPSGSEHYYFKLPAEVVIKNSASLIAPGVDVRGEGGMVIAPPSIKPGKGNYEWVVWCDIAEAPAWLIELCRESTSKKMNGVHAVNGAASTAPADQEKLLAAIAVIPNDDLGWEDWNKVGMALYAAFDGSDAGLAAFKQWSQKSGKYDEAGTEDKWDKLHGSSPDQLTVGTLFYLADQAAPGWRAPFANSDSAAKQELAEACTAFAECTPDRRDTMLDEAAFYIGQLVGAGRLHEQTARLRLKAAGLNTGYAEEILETIIASGMARGKNKPRLPIIKVYGGSIARNIESAETELTKSGEAIFQRAGQFLVQPRKYELAAADGKMTEIMALRPMVADNLIFELSKHGAIFQSYDKRSKKWVNINPPRDVASGLLHKGQWKLKNVAGVITTPTMLPDGSLLQTPGYDFTTQLYYSPDKYLDIPEIKIHPTKADAQAALEFLKGPLVEFPFVSELDEAVAVAGMMTPVLRGAYGVAPPFLIAAHQPGSGKTHMVNSIATAATGRPCPASTYSPNEEENVKALGANILKGVGIISLDNCSRDLGGDFLAQITEQRIVSIRILGKSETVDCEWGGTFFATGNNVGWKADMTRRGLVCNLDPELERPENRTFAHDPIKMIAQNRGAYIAAILTIARAYRVADEKINCDGFASYEQWSAAVREPLIWLGMQDPKKSQDASTADDPIRTAARELCGLWRAHLMVGVGYTAAQIIKKAKETVSVSGGNGTHTAELVNPELHDLLKMHAADVRGNIDPKRLGSWIKNIKGQIHDGHRIVLVREDSARGNRYALQARAADGSWGGAATAGAAAPPDSETAF